MLLLYKYQIGLKDISKNDSPQPDFSHPLLSDPAPMFDYFMCLFWYLPPCLQILYLYYSIH